MHTGKVKRIFRNKGFGFIHATDGREIFFHNGSLLDIRFNDLNEEQKVEFEVHRTFKGPRAINVNVVE